MEVIFNKLAQKVPIKTWCLDAESGAIEQARNMSNLPFVFHHVALMPDTHQGYGMPIGGVLATDPNIIIPHAVGSDIGCGMLLFKTSLTDITKFDIKRIFGGSKEYQGGIRTKIPVGFSHHSAKQDEKYMPVHFITNIADHICCLEYSSALKQIGTLGSGNHFLEFQKGSDGFIYVMIHSGSRNLGYKVGDFYNKVAKEMMQRWYSNIDPKWQLDFLPLDSKYGQRYQIEMQYCVEFALANRKLMMERIKECILEVIPDVKFEKEINIAHNYAQLENHFGKNVMIHRKGATLARKDTIGIIPGSQGSKSYIVQGKGNPDSFMSCSHGAGRCMSRKRAVNELNLKAEIKYLDNMGVIHSIRNKKDLDEAPSSYKDISVVMENQKDLVDILIELTPLAVIKG